MFIICMNWGIRRWGKSDDTSVLSQTASVLEGRTHRSDIADIALCTATRWNTEVLSNSSIQWALVSGVVTDVFLAVQCASAAAAAAAVSQRHARQHHACCRLGPLNKHDPWNYRRRSAQISPTLPRRGIVDEGAGNGSRWHAEGSEMRWSSTASPPRNDLSSASSINVCRHISPRL